MSDVIGVIPSVDKTFEIYGDLNSSDPIEGKLYYDKETKKLYYYSMVETRSNPSTGYFPIWNGKNKFETKFSKEKYLDKDAIMIDIESINKSVNKELSEFILYQQRKSSSDNELNPIITDGDNIFTQCIKGTISNMKITMVDLIDMGKPKIPQNIIESYYSALTKITFMRYDKWVIWIDSILHINYTIDIYKDNKKILSYKYPSDELDTGIVKYDKVVNVKDDPFKKIVKLLMIIENINKNSLRSDISDDYTINNMITTLNSNKPLSAQLFSRFIRMSNLSYKMTILKEGKILFEYKE